MGALREGVPVLGPLGTCHPVSSSADAPFSSTNLHHFSSFMNVHFFQIFVLMAADLAATETYFFLSEAVRLDGVSLRANIFIFSGSALAFQCAGLILQSLPFCM